MCFFILSTNCNINTLKYTCNKEISIHLKQCKKNKYVKVFVKAKPKTSFKAYKVISASGEKYIGNGYTFWLKGSECLIEKDDKKILENCCQNSLK